MFLKAHSQGVFSCPLICFTPRGGSQQTALCPRSQLQSFNLLRIRIIAMDPTENLIFIIFCFVGFWLSVIPLYWHLQGKLPFTNGPKFEYKRSTFTAWNTGTCVYMVWTALGCLIYCINAILWRGNVIDKAPIYCDISKADAYFPNNPLTGFPSDPPSSRA